MLFWCSSMRYMAAHAQVNCAERCSLCKRGAISFGDCPPARWSPRPIQCLTRRGSRTERNPVAPAPPPAPPAAAAGHANPDQQWSGSIMEVPLLLQATGWLPLGEQCIALKEDTGMLTVLPAIQGAEGRCPCRSSSLHQCCISAAGCRSPRPPPPSRRSFGDRRVSRAA